MRGFSERNPIIIAVVGLVVIAVLCVAVFYSDDLPIIGGGTSYAADFTDASGLKSGDDVRIAGVKVGTVDSVSLTHGHVRVDFKAKNAWIGDRSTAAIKIKTLLGQEYVDIDPQGGAQLPGGSTIPTTRTTTPIDVQAALNGLSTTVGSINTTQLAASFNALSGAFKDTPRSVHEALNGLTSLSTTIASRDSQIRNLAANTDELSGTLAANNRHFGKLIRSGALLLGELQARSSAITRLLRGTRRLATQLSGLAADNQNTLRPALSQLSRVTTVLNANHANLHEALRLIGPYYSLLRNAGQSGPWLDIYICGLFNRDDTPIIDATAKRNCSPRGGS